MEFDNRRVRFIIGIACVLLALVFTFVMPLTIAPVGVTMVATTGDPNLEPPGQGYVLGGSLDVGSESINAYAQEFEVENCEIELINISVGRFQNTDTNLVVGVADVQTLNPDAMLTYIILTPADVGSAVEKQMTGRIYPLNEVLLQNNTTYYVIFALESGGRNSTIKQYAIENVEIELEWKTYEQSWSAGTDWSEITTPPLYGATDIFFELYGTYIFVNDTTNITNGNGNGGGGGGGGGGASDSQLIDTQTAKFMILWLGSIMMGIGLALIVSLHEELQNRPIIPFIVGILAFIGWFLFVANPWLIFTMVRPGGVA